MYPSRSHALVLKIHSLLGNPFVALTLLFRGGGAVGLYFPIFSFPPLCNQRRGQTKISERLKHKNLQTGGAKRYTQPFLLHFSITILPIFEK